MELQEILANPEEDQRLELKASMTWEAIKPKIIRGVMALANAHGGTFVVGFSEDKSNLTWEPTGIDAEHLSEYDPDQIRENIIQHCTPPPMIDVKLDSDGGLTFLLINVNRFSIAPIIAKQNCKADAKGGVYQGAVYYRSLKPASVRISSEQWLEVMNVFSVESGTRWLTEMANRGWTIQAPGTQVSALTSPSTDRFKQQGGDI